MYKFEMESNVEIRCSGETGVVIGRSSFLEGPDQYLVQYKTATGEAVERWWGESALIKN